MSGTNHITGGIVFTGIFASFWNINIFSRPELLAATGFFAILPDIDHLKSPIGKAFYPLAKWLDRRYGHRTITHSLTVFIPGIFLVLFLERSLSDHTVYSVVFAFAYFSHLLFDMLTKQGIPLFYPFKRNPCVIPGNPEMRLRSSDLKTEAACFGIFVLLGITCQNLFANGFWNTYNRQFSDLKHLHQHAQQSETTLAVSFSFRAENGKEMNGSGLLVKSTESEAVLLSNKRFIRITKNDRIQSLLPIRTATRLTVKELFFSGISPDSLQRLTNGKAITVLSIQSNTVFAYTKDNKPESGQRAELAFIISPALDFASNKPASVADTTTGKKQILQYELNKEIQRLKELKAARANLVASINQLSDEISRMDLYEREKATKELAKLQHDLSAFPTIEDNTGKIRIQLRQAENKPVIQPEAVKVNGYLSYIPL